MVSSGGPTSLLGSNSAADLLHVVSLIICFSGLLGRIQETGSMKKDEEDEEEDEVEAEEEEEEERRKEEEDEGGQRRRRWRRGRRRCGPYVELSM